MLPEIIVPSYNFFLASYEYEVLYYLSLYLQAIARQISNFAVAQLTRMCQKQELRLLKKLRET